MKNYNIEKEDYSKFLSKFPYDKKDIYNKAKRENKKLKKNECYNINSLSRNKNKEFFDKSLQKVILNYLIKSQLGGEEVKTLLGINYSTLALFYEKEEAKSFDFKLIYDLYIVLNVKMSEFIEKLEDLFL